MGHRADCRLIAGRVAERTAEPGHFGSAQSARRLLEMHDTEPVKVRREIADLRISCRCPTVSRLLGPRIVQYRNSRAATVLSARGRSRPGSRSQPMCVDAIRRHRAPACPKHRIAANALIRFSPCYGRLSIRQLRGCARASSSQLRGLVHRATPAASLSRYAENSLRISASSCLRVNTSSARRNTLAVSALT